MDTQRQKNRKYANSWQEGNSLRDSRRDPKKGRGYEGKEMLNFEPGLDSGR